MILSWLAGTESKDYTSMLILRDETALITEIFIAGFILWLVNIHRYTRILPILSAPSGTGRNCHSLSDYIMIAKPFHATRPFIRIEILRQERQVFSSNPTISNYNFELVPRSFFHCWRCGGGGWRRFIDWLYVIVKVFIVGFCYVITEHTPTCRDLILCRLSLSAILATVCCWSIDWWRRPIEQLYVIVKMLISCFCSECTIGCCHLAYRERRKLRPQMRKIQTPSPQLTETEQFALNIVLAAFISCTELVWASPIYIK